jgi:hypothetical protein
MMKSILTLGSCLVLIGNIEAQDLGFINVNQSLVNLNPSFAGSNGFIRDQASFGQRQLSPNIAKNYYWVSNSFDLYLKPLSAGLAVTAHTESYGEIIGRKSYGLVYAQHLNLCKGTIKLIPSIQAVYKMSDYNPDFQQFSSRKPNYADLNAGLLFTYREKLYVGGSVFHLTEKPDHGFSSGREQRYFTFHSSYSINIGDRHLFQVVGIVTRYYSNTSSRLMVNSVLYDHFITGVGYNFQQGGFLTAGYRARNFSIAAGCTVSWSKYVSGISGWEIHASFNLRNKENRAVLTVFEKM